MSRVRVPSPAPRKENMSRQIPVPRGLSFAEKSPTSYVEEELEETLKGPSCYLTGDNLKFALSDKVKIYKTLPPGLYEFRPVSSEAYGFEKVVIKDDDLLQFPDSVAERVINEIKTFWEKSEEYYRFGLSYKRGIILYGPPGTGKSATITLALRDVVDRGGVGLVFNDPDLVNAGVKYFRAIQPNSPLVVIMEDLDAIMERFNESSVLNLLDGVQGLDKVVFLATTNYPDRLAARVMNRPSRFDRRFKIGPPSEETRRLYLTSLISKSTKPDAVDIDVWIRDTRDMSISHLKELFIAVHIQESPYEETLERLKAMSIQVKSEEEFRPAKKVGFGSKGFDDYEDC